MSEISSVYWIHLASHSDITNEGYIGVTSKEPEDRFKQHLAWSKTSNIILSKAIRKYDDEIIVTTLLKGSDEYCYLMESKLRPEDRIGWNTVAGGGGKPPIKNTPHTKEAKKKISEASKKNSQTEAHLAYRARRVGAKRSDEARANMRAAQAGKHSWEASRANKSVWKQADKFYDLFKETGMGDKSLCKLFDVKVGTFSALLNKFKQNWNPKADPLWTEWVCPQNTNKESK